MESGFLLSRLFLYQQGVFCVASIVRHLLSTAMTCRDNRFSTWCPHVPTCDPWKSAATKPHPRLQVHHDWLPEFPADCVECDWFSCFNLGTLFYHLLSSGFCCNASKMAEWIQKFIQNSFCTSNPPALQCQAASDLLRAYAVKNSVGQPSSMCLPFLQRSIESMSMIKSGRHGNYRNSILSYGKAKAQKKTKGDENFTMFDNTVSNLKL